MSASRGARGAGLSEEGDFLSEAGDVGVADFAGPVAAKVAVTEIVAEDKDHIGLEGVFGGACAKQFSEKDQKK